MLRRKLSYQGLNVFKFTHRGRPNAREQSAYGLLKIITGIIDTFTQAFQPLVAAEGLVLLPDRHRPYAWKNFLLLPCWSILHLNTGKTG